MRRDEAKAAEEEKERERRALLADQEARTALLRNKARERLTDEQKAELDRVSQASQSGPARHVNLFEDLEGGETTAAGNKEHETEKKKEQEEYEKKIGLLTYLGQDTEELTGNKSWWLRLPTDRQKKEEEEVGKNVEKFKDFNDPLKDIRKYLGCSGVRQEAKKVEKKRKRSPSVSSEDDKKKRKRSKHKKTKKSKHKKKKKKKSRGSSSDDESNDEEEKKKKADMMEKLRAQRLLREKSERERTRKLLSGEQDKPKEPVREKGPKRKYNSQFNPDIARQNKLDAKKKYWLE